jgi:hypothetical protein
LTVQKRQPEMFFALLVKPVLHLPVHQLQLGCNLLCFS